MSSPLVDLQLLYTAAPVVTHLGHALLVQHMVARERLAPDTWRVQALQANAAARRIRPVTTVRVGACIGSSMYAVLVTRAVCTGILDPLPGPLLRERRGRRRVPENSSMVRSGTWALGRLHGFWGRHGTESRGLGRRARGLGRHGAQSCILCFPGRTGILLLDFLLDLP